MIKDIDVLILCGGRGERLKKITGKVPKPMVRIGRKVFLDIIIDYLRGFGFKRFILGIGYQAKFIRKYYGGHRPAGIEVIFSQENKPLGTGGAVKKAQRHIKSADFLVLNGDTFSKFNARNFVKFYKKKKARVLILLRRVKTNKDYGAITINKNSKITSFNEKSPSAPGNFINAGVYLFNRNIFPEMPEQARFSLEYDFFPRIVGKGFYGYNKPGFFIDIGTPERYFSARKYFLKR